MPVGVERDLLGSVLVVDDSQDMRHLMRIMLDLDQRWRLLGEAPDGERGIELARELRPDIVVLDFEMPGWTGCRSRRS